MYQYPSGPVYGGSQYNPATGAESRDMRPLSSDDPRFSQRQPMQQPGKLGMLGGMPNRPTDKMPTGPMYGLNPVIMDGDGGMRPPGYPPQTGGTTPLPFSDPNLSEVGGGMVTGFDPKPTGWRGYGPGEYRGPAQDGGTNMLSAGPHRVKGPAPYQENTIEGTFGDSPGSITGNWGGGFRGFDQQQQQQQQNPFMGGGGFGGLGGQQGGFGQQQMNPFMGGGMGGFGQQQMNPFMGGGGFGGFGQQQMNPFMGGGFGGFGGFGQQQMNPFMGGGMGGFGQQQMNPFMGGGGFGGFGGMGGYGQQMQNPFMGGGGFGGFGQQMQNRSMGGRGFGQTMQQQQPMQQQQQPMQQPMGYQGGAF